MFVIAQSFNNIEKDSELSKLSIEDKIGLTLKHAGVAITITSVTDIVCFSIGASSVISI